MLTKYKLILTESDKDILSTILNRISTAAIAGRWSETTEEKMNRELLEKKLWNVSRETLEKS